MIKVPGNKWYDGASYTSSVLKEFVWEMMSIALAYLSIASWYMVSLASWARGRGRDLVLPSRPCPPLIAQVYESS
jgi:hypothetical protein